MGSDLAVPRPERVVPQRAARRAQRRRPRGQREQQLQRTLRLPGAGPPRFCKVVAFVKSLTFVKWPWRPPRRALCGRGGAGPRGRRAARGRRPGAQQQTHLARRAALAPENSDRGAHGVRRALPRARLRGRARLRRVPARRRGPAAARRRGGAAAAEAEAPSPRCSAVARTRRGAWASEAASAASRGSPADKAGCSAQPARSVRARATPGALGASARGAGGARLVANEAVELSLRTKIRAAVRRRAAEEPARARRGRRREEPPEHLPSPSKGSQLSQSVLSSAVLVASKDGLHP
jgi:hypothetical protein